MPSKGPRSGCSGMLDGNQDFWKDMLAASLFMNLSKVLWLRLLKFLLTHATFVFTKSIVLSTADAKSIPTLSSNKLREGVIFGLSAALYEQISLKNGAVTNSNFHDYRVARLSEYPEVFVSIIENNEAPGGVGEPGVPPVAPALCNAIYAATAKRIRRLPVASQLI